MGDMTGQRPSGGDYENLGRKHYFGEDCIFWFGGDIFWFWSLVLEIG
jgi:hypothetical protein